MFWPFDLSEPYLTAEQALEYQCQRRGIGADGFALPPTLVATFQRDVYERFIARAGLPPDDQGKSGGFGPVVGAVDGVPAAIARISIGAPAAAIVMEEAIARGVRTILVVGGAGSLQPTVPVGSTVIVDRAEREDGTSHHYLPAGELVMADAGLSALLEGCARSRGLAPARGRTWTIDAPYRETIGAIRRHRAAGVAVVEMEAAAIFAVAQVRGVRAALIVAVWDELFDLQWRAPTDADTYTDALLRAADAAMDAVTLLG